jgi:hypothetical protein
MPIPPPPTTGVTIFDTDPGAATQTIFEQGIPATSTDVEMLAIVLFSPNLQLIASLDNTGSDATSNYSTSVSHGFTFSATQTLSITAEVGVNIEIVTAKVSVTFALSFTEAWTTTTTKTMTVSCPPGKKAFVYQGTLMSKLMKFDDATAQYSWVTGATKALTDVVVTTNTPVGSAPSNPVTMA